MDKSVLWAHALMTVSIIYFSCILIDKIYVWGVKNIRNFMDKLKIRLIFEDK